MDQIICNVIRVLAGASRETIESLLKVGLDVNMKDETGNGILERAFSV